jgi:hypothetical protein
MQKHYAKVFCCDGAGAGGRLELRPPVESSESQILMKRCYQLTTTPVRDTSSVRIWFEI